MDNLIAKKILLSVVIAGITVQAFYNCGSRAAADDLLDRRITVSPDSSYAISGVINDPDDPVSLVGINFIIPDSILSSENLLVRLSSSNTSVVPDANLILSGSDAKRNLKIKAVSAGYATITVTVTNGIDSIAYVLNYAASQATDVAGKRWHTNISDASAAIEVGDDYMMVANDETNYLYLYNKNHSGQPVKFFDFNQGNILGLTDSSSGKWKEADVEAGVRSISNSNLIYWIGSMSNNGSFFNKPNRNKLFAITIAGKGAAASFANAGHYSGLRQKLIAWGNAHGYDFSKSAAVGKNPKLIDGFNIEGMVFALDNTTMYIGFRAPLVPIGNRTKAVIAPIQNFENWFNNGSPVDTPTIAAPIELDLGGRGIRDVIRLPNGNYIILAGSSDFEIKPAVYSWTGHAKDVPVSINSFAVTGLNAEGVLPVYEAGRLSLNKLQLLTDNGNDIYYGDTIAAKNLPAYNFKKFTSVIIQSPQREVLRPR